MHKRFDILFCGCQVTTDLFFFNRIHSVNETLTTLFANEKILHNIIQFEILGVGGRSKKNVEQKARKHNVKFNREKL